MGYQRDSSVEEDRENKINNIIQNNTSIEISRQHEYNCLVRGIRIDHSRESDGRDSNSSRPSTNRPSQLSLQVLLH